MKELASRLMGCDGRRSDREWCHVLALQCSAKRTPFYRSCQHHTQAKDTTMNNRKQENDTATTGDAQNGILAAMPSITLLEDEKEQAANDANADGNVNRAIDYSSDGDNDEEKQMETAKKGPQSNANVTQQPRLEDMEATTVENSTGKSATGAKSSIHDGHMHDELLDLEAVIPQDCTSSREVRESCPAREPREESQPGAFAVCGPGASHYHNSDEYTTTAPATVEPDETNELIAAELVNTEEENRKIEARIEKETQEKLKQELAEREKNAPIAEVVSDRLCSPRMKRLSIAGVLLMIAGIVLAIVFSQDDPTAPPKASSDPTATGSTTQLTWTKLGRDIDGKAEFDRFGHTVDLSDDGTVLAIGASNGAYVRVFAYEQDEMGQPLWRQRGEDIVVPAWGGAVSISADGTVVAVGDMFSEYETYGGQVFVYRWTEVEAGTDEGFQWVLIGQAINGTKAEGTGEFGRSVSLSANGTMVAVGAWFLKQVSVFGLNGDEWVQVGDTIDAPDDNSSSFGMSVSLSGDGSSIAVGDPGNDQVTIYSQMEGDWIRTNQGLINNDEQMEEASLIGGSVSLSRDGSKVAAGSYGMKIFGLHNDVWSLQFSDNMTSGFSFGNKVDMSSNGNAVAGRGFDGIRIFSMSSQGIWMQLGQDINDTDIDGDFDESDRSIAISANGTVVAVGSVYQEVGGGPGFVRVFRLESI